MHPTKVMKFNGGKNPKDNPKRNQITHLQGWTARPTKSNLEEN
jgi:hypothetical protein